MGSRSNDEPGCLGAAVGGAFWVFFGIPLLCFALIAVLSGVVWLIEGVGIVLKVLAIAIAAPIGIVLTTFAVAALIDISAPLRRFVSGHLAARQNLAKCPSPSLRAFQGYPENTFDRFLALILTDAYRKEFGSEPDERSFEGDEAGYLQFRRQYLPKMVLSKAYRPIVDDLYIRFYRLWCRNELPEGVTSFLNELIETETKRHSLAATGRVLDFLSYHRLGLQAGEASRPRTVSEYKRDPDLFTAILWRCFLLHLDDISQLLPDPVTKPAVEKAEDVYIERVKLLFAHVPKSTPSEEPKTTEEKAPTPGWKNKLERAKDIFTQATTDPDLGTAGNALSEAMAVLDEALADPDCDQDTCYAFRAELLTKLSRCEGFARVFGEALEADRKGMEVPTWFAESYTSTLMGQDAVKREAFRRYFEDDG